MDTVIDLGRLWLIVRRNITLMIVLGIAMAVVVIGNKQFIRTVVKTIQLRLVNRKR